MASPRDVQAAMLRLAVDASTVRVLRALSHARVRSILLRGPTFERALYADGTLRPYSDTDLLVSPADVERAGRALERMGLDLVLDHRAHAAIVEPHAQEWGPDGEWRTVDLHWRIPGVGAGPASAWATLARRTVPFVIGGERAESLDVPGIAMLVALHAAHHGTARGGPRSDLERALAVLERDAWERAAALAADLDAAMAFAAGLRLVPVGAQLARDLGLEAATTAERRLVMSAPPPGAVGLLGLLHARGAAERVAWLRTSLLPSAAFMRAEYASARRGRRGLALAHVRRLAARLRALPAAVRAVRRARGS